MAMMARVLGSFCSAMMVAAGAGAVEFTPCAEYGPDDRAECTSITVLEDRARPDGRTIELHVVVLRAETPRPGRAPVFFLAGGPGQGATDLAGIVLGPYAAVRGDRDVVLVDQRGTGGSNLLDCRSNADEDPGAAFGGLYDPERVAECREMALTHADPRFYGTSHVVADLDEVREALGYASVVLWGGSGGTRTALVWLREHPERVEAVALDGVAPTDFRAPSGYARGCQDALDHVFEDCEVQTSCNEAYPDLRADFERLLRRFDDGPVRTFVTREDTRVDVEMHRGDFAYAVRGILYRSALIRELPKMIHEAAASNDLSAFAQLHWERAVGLAPFVAMGVHWSVFGTEDVPFIDSTRVAELTEGTFVGRYLIDQYTAACKAWGGRGTLPAGFHDPVRSEAPVLLLSGYYDPSTPPHVAEKVARHLPNSRHIVVRNEGHGAGFSCARQVVTDFLIHASLEGLGPACEDVGAIEFTVD